MNKQKTSKGRGIEWCDYTWNPIAGCYHGCRWEMPDGTIAVCYAETTSERFRNDKVYPEGFEHYYWHPERLKKPSTITTPSKIFVGSMADVFGNWVPEEHILAVLEVAKNNPQHTFQFLTKNPSRVTKFIGHIPSNAWIGASTPPGFMRARSSHGKFASRCGKTPLQRLRN